MPADSQASSGREPNRGSFSATGIFPCCTQVGASPADMRLFVGVSLPDRLTSNLATIRTLHPGVSRGKLLWEPESRMHVTLRFLGEESPEVAIAALERVRLREPVECALGAQTGRFSNSLLHVPVFGLNELASDVVTATENIGVQPDKRAFTGHVTLARVKGGYLPAEDCDLGLNPDELAFTVDSFKLFKSENVANTVAYTNIKTFPLENHGSG